MKKILLIILFATPAYAQYIGDPPPEWNQGLLLNAHDAQGASCWEEAQMAGWKNEAIGNKNLAENLNDLVVQYYQEDLLAEIENNPNHPMHENWEKAHSGWTLGVLDEGAGYPYHAAGMMFMEWADQNYADHMNGHHWVITGYYTIGDPPVQYPYFGWACPGGDLWGCANYSNTYWLTGLIQFGTIWYVPPPDFWPEAACSIKYFHDAAWQYGISAVAWEAIYEWIWSQYPIV